MINKATTGALIPLATIAAPAALIARILIAIHAAISTRLPVSLAFAIAPVGRCLQRLVGGGIAGLVSRRIARPIGRTAISFVGALLLAGNGCGNPKADNAQRRSATNTKPLFVAAIRDVTRLWSACNRCARARAGRQ